MPQKKRQAPPLDTAAGLFLTLCALSGEFPATLVSRLTSVLLTEVENDAMDEDGPVLFGYTCDMPCMKRFMKGLDVHGLKGTLYCFDFQEDAMRQVCEPNVNIQCIDFEAFEELL